MVTAGNPDAVRSDHVDAARCRDGRQAVLRGQPVFSADLGVARSKHDGSLEATISALSGDSSHLIGGHCEYRKVRCPGKRIDARVADLPVDVGSARVDKVQAPLEAAQTGQAATAPRTVDWRCAHQGHTGWT